MSFTVTSLFQSQMESTNPSSIVKKFTFNGSDISAFVTQYSSIVREITDLEGKNFTIELENADQRFDDLITKKTQFDKEGKFEYGYMIDTGSMDLVSLFTGNLTRVSLRNHKVVMNFRDSLSRLSKRKVGSSDTPVSFTNTSVNPADLAWWLVTSYGDFSSVKSTSNPDVDYDSWFTWWNIFNDDSVLVKANFTGQEIPDLLNKIRVLTDSVIFDEGDNDVHFARWTGAASDSLTIVDSIIKSIDVSVSGLDLINKVKVLIDYDVTSKIWGGEITSQNTESVNSYGIFEEVYEFTEVWYVNSVSAINLADRTVFRRNEPNAQINITAPLVMLQAAMGDEYVLSSEVFSFNQKTVDLQKNTIDINKGEMTMVLDEGFGRGVGRIRGFILDHAVFGLLDQDYNPLT